MADQTAHGAAEHRSITLKSPYQRKQDVFDSDDFEPIKFINQIYPDGEHTPVTPPVLAAMKPLHDLGLVGCKAAPHTRPAQAGRQHQGREAAWAPQVAATVVAAAGDAAARYCWLFWQSGRLVWTTCYAIHAHTMQSPPWATWTSLWTCSASRWAKHLMGWGMAAKAVGDMPTEAGSLLELTCGL